VIASNVGGLPEIIQSGVTGFICAPEAIREMADRCAELARDEPRRLTMGRAAAAMVRAAYCTPIVVPLYERAYTRATGQVAE
jgi:L-malate glycosyltransferase